MSKYEQIDRIYEKLAVFIFRRPLQIFLITIVILVPLCLSICNITVDTSQEGLLHSQDSAIVTYQKFLKQFGDDKNIVVAIECDDIFTNKNIDKLIRLHEKIEKDVPYVHEVKSLVNARVTYETDSTLYVEKLFPEQSNISYDMDKIKRDAMSNPLYKNHYISEDGKISVIFVHLQAFKMDGENSIGNSPMNRKKEREELAINDELKKLTDDDYHEVHKVIHKITKEFEDPGFRIILAGTPIAIDYLKHFALDDMLLFSLIALVGIALLLLILFKRISGVVLPLIIIIFTTLFTLGLMAVFGTPIKIPTTVIPSFLLSVCVGDSVHVLTFFYRRLNMGNSKEESVAYAFKHTGFAITMTTATTAGALITFANSEISAIVDMGIFASVGAIGGLLFTIIFLPALLAVSPIKKYTYSKHKKILIGQALGNRILCFFADVSTLYKKQIVFISIILFIIVSSFIPKMHFTHFPLSWFPDSVPIKKNMTFLDGELKGTTAIEVIIDTKETSGIYDPSLLKSIDSLCTELLKDTSHVIQIGKILSVIDVIKEINQALHANNHQYYHLPDHRDIIAQELLLFENSGSEDLGSLVSGDYSKMRLTLMIPNVDGILLKNRIQEIQKAFTNILNEKATVELTGASTLTSRVIMAVLSGILKGYLLAFLVVTLMMLIIVQDWKIGLLCMFPNILPILSVLGIMGMSGITMDINTSLIGSIAIGLIVDDTIHYIYGFRRAFDKTRNVHSAIRETFMTSGKAMLITTIALCVGFFSLSFAAMKCLAKFGLLTTIAIVLALLADFLLCPALLCLTQKQKGN